MNSTSDLFNEDFQVPFKFFNQILSSANPTTPVIRITNRPLFFPRVRYPHITPVIGVNLNNTHQQEILKINENEDLREVSCIGNKVNGSGESIIHECSKSSLNLSAIEDEPDGSSEGSIYQEAKKSYHVEEMYEDLMDGELSDLNQFGSNEKHLSLISTTSSSSSTREYYLPAVTGSTDTVRRTGALGTSRIKTPKYYSKKQSNLINSIGLKPAAQFLDNRPKMLNKSNKQEGTLLAAQKTSQETRNFNANEIFQAGLFNNISNPMSASEKFSRYDAQFEPVHNKKTNINQEAETKETNDNSQKTSTIQEESNLSFPSPSEWIKEIHNSKLVIKQDIIEKDFSASKENSKTNFRAPNSHFFDLSTPRTLHKHGPRPTDQNIRQVLSLGNSQDINMPKIKTTSNLCDAKIEILNYFEKNAKHLKDLFTENDQMHPKNLNIVSNNSQLEAATIPETEQNDYLTEVSDKNYFAHIPQGKFHELPGLLDEIKDKPDIKNLVVTSQVLSESLEIESNEETPQYEGIDNPPIEQAKPQRTNNDENSSETPPALMEESINDKTNLERSRGDFSLNRSFYILNESIPTDIDAFKQVRDFFNLSKAQTPGNNEKYTVVANHENSTEIFSKILNIEKQSSEVTGGEKVFDQGKNSISDSKTEKPKEILEDKQFEIEESLKFEIDCRLNSGKDDLLKTKQENMKNLEEFRGRIISKNRLPAFVYDKSGFPLTDTKGRILKNNQDIPLVNIENDTVLVYDAGNISNDHPAFDASKRPTITTLVKITDQVKNPASLYNNLGLPLTDEDGMLLHDCRGNILVTMDSNFFPLCCKTGMPIYLRNGTSWLSQRCKFTVTTQHKAKVASAMSIDTEQNNKGNDNINSKLLESINVPISDLREHELKIKPIKRDEAVETDFENHILEKGDEKAGSLISLTDILRDLGYSTSENKIKDSTFFDSLEKIDQGHFFQIYDVEGNCLTDSQGYPLRNEYGESLVLFDKEGNPISDWCGGALFDSNGEPLYISNQYAPERPYSDESFEESPRLMYSSQIIPEESLDNYQHNEPLLSIIKRNDLRALNINSDIVPSVKYIHSFPDRSYYEPAGNNYAKNYSKERIHMYNNGIYDSYYEEGEENYKETSEIDQTPNDLSVLSVESIENESFFAEEQQSEFLNPYNRAEGSRSVQKYGTAQHTYQEYSDSAYFYSKSVQYY